MISITSKVTAQSHDVMANGSKVRGLTTTSFSTLLRLLASNTSHLGRPAFDGYSLRHRHLLHPPIK